MWEANEKWNFAHKVIVASSRQWSLWICKESPKKKMLDEKWLNTHVIMWIITLCLWINSWTITVCSKGFLTFFLSHCTALKITWKQWRNFFLPGNAKKTIYFTWKLLRFSLWVSSLFTFFIHLRYSFHLTCFMQKSTMLDEVANGYES